MQQEKFGRLYFIIYSFLIFVVVLNLCLNLFEKRILSDEIMIFYYDILSDEIFKKQCIYISNILLETYKVLYIIVHYGI